MRARYNGLSMHRPLQTFAWRDRVHFIPWADPGIWHQMQQVGFAAQGASR